MQKGRESVIVSETKSRFQKISCHKGKISFNKEIKKFKLNLNNVGYPVQSNSICSNPFLYIPNKPFSQGVHLLFYQNIVIV